MKPVDKLTRLRFRCLTVAGIEILLFDVLFMVFVVPNALRKMGIPDWFEWSRFYLGSVLWPWVFFTVCGVLILLSVFFSKMYHVLAVLTFFVFGSITVLLTSFGARPSYLLIWGVISLVFLLPHLIYEIAWFRRPARISTLESEKEGSSL